MITPDMRDKEADDVPTAVSRGKEREKGLLLFTGVRNEGFSFQVRR